MAKHVVVIEIPDNDQVPASNPTTNDVLAYLNAAIAHRQGEGRDPGVAHVWWMRGVEAK